MTTQLKVKEILSGGHHGEAVTQEIEQTGMILRQRGALAWPSRYAWLLVELPNHRELRVLAERVDEQAGDVVHVRFKHLFPEHRRLLDEILAPVAA
jgi:2'-5' RNA ligase